MTDDWKTSVDWARMFGRTPDEWQKATTRLVHPSLVPDTSAGQARWLRNTTAALIEFSMLSRSAGYSPEAIQAITKLLDGQLRPGCSEWVAIGGEGNTADVIDLATLQAPLDFIAPFARLGRIQFINIRSIVKKLGPATPQPSQADIKAKRDEFVKRSAKTKVRA